MHSLIRFFLKILLTFIFISNLIFTESRQIISRLIYFFLHNKFITVHALVIIFIPKASKTLFTFFIKKAYFEHILTFYEKFIFFYALHFF